LVRVNPNRISGLFVTVVWILQRAIKSPPCENSRSHKDPVTKKSTSQLWIDAVIALEKGPDFKVPCAECEYHFLEVTDAAWPDGSRIDRHLHCPSCKSRNVATKVIARTEVWIERVARMKPFTGFAPLR
jgi:hypothetical protein